MKDGIFLPSPNDDIDIAQKFPHHFYSTKLLVSDWEKTCFTKSWSHAILVPELSAQVMDPCVDFSPLGEYFPGKAVFRDGGRPFDIVSRRGTD